MSASSLPKPAHVTVRYHGPLQEITGNFQNDILISGQLPFVQFLHFVFSNYPEIEQKYPPGVLGFKVNNQLPKEHSKLRDGDLVEFIVAD